MSTRLLTIYCLPMLLLLVGCVTSRPQPYFGQAVIAQQELTILDETLITVKVNDPYDIVRKVEGLVLEGTSELIFSFHDDGEKGDAIAGDTVWSIRVKVPYDGWAGTFTFQITAYNDNHEPIIVLDEFKEVAPMTTTLRLEVKLPEAPEAKEDAAPETKEDAP